MKKLLFSVIASIVLFSCKGPESALCSRHGMMNEGGWFKVQDITPENGTGNVYMISEHNDATCYLVTGSKYAMLIDTGIGVGDLSDLVSSLTDLPLIVVTTHGHPDHIGGNYQFSEVWLPEKDLDVMKSMNPLNNPDLEAYVASYAKDFKYDVEAVKRNIEEIKTYPDYELRLFGPGKSWDLGGKVITTLELGGHTPGSILFLDEADDMVFSGDAMNGYLWMWSDHCLSIEEYEKNLAAVVPELKNFGHIYGGHEFRPQGMESSQAETMLADLHSVLNGEVQPVPTPKPMDGEGTVNVYYFKTWLLWAK
ncbi:MAG: MBL fold metallo-hydrolase [Bacteroidales bacterium]|nr:MBL fold metallo-hydrolase [Bacteroidales bacterium]